MTPQAAARPYAGALFEVTAAPVRAAASTSLSGFAALLTSNADLRKVVESPAIPAPTKRRVLEALMQQSGDVPHEVGRLVLLLADQDDLALLPHVAQAFAARVRQAAGEVDAEVVTAVPLDEAGRSALEAALGRATGGKVKVHARVDPTILGGLVAKVGSTVFDGSVTRQLERLRQKLLIEA